MSTYWKIFPSSLSARALLLSKGMQLRGKPLPLHGQNPFLHRGGDGREIESTRLSIDRIPLSLSNDEILDSLKKNDVHVLGPLTLERDRDEQGKLTRFVTGRRLVWIEVPKSPLPKQLQMGPCRAFLYHKEMKEKRTVVCNNCFLEGHVAKNCENPVVCRKCRKPGHRAIDGCDSLFQVESEDVEATREEREKESVGIEEGEVSESESEGESEKDVETEDEKEKKEGERSGKKKVKGRKEPTKPNVVEKKKMDDSNNPSNSTCSETTPKKQRGREKERKSKNMNATIPQMFNGRAGSSSKRKQETPEESVSRRARLDS